MPPPPWIGGGTEGGVDRGVGFTPLYIYIYIKSVVYIFIYIRLYSGQISDGSRRGSVPNFSDDFCQVIPKLRPHNTQAQECGADANILK